MSIYGRSFLVYLLVTSTVLPSPVANATNAHGAQIDFPETKRRLIEGVTTEWAITQLKHIFTTPKDAQYLNSLLQKSKREGTGLLRVKAITETDNVIEVISTDGERLKLFYDKNGTFQINGRTVTSSKGAERYFKELDVALDSNPTAALMILPLLIFDALNPHAEAYLLYPLMAVGLVGVLGGSFALGQRAKASVMAKDEMANTEERLKKQDTQMTAEDWTLALSRKCKIQSEEQNRLPYNQSRVYKLLLEISRLYPNIYDVLELKPKGSCDQKHIDEIVNGEKLLKDIGRDPSIVCGYEAKFLECMKKYRETSAPSTSTESAPSGDDGKSIDGSGSK